MKVSRITRIMLFRMIAVAVWAAIGILLTAQSHAEQVTISSANDGELDEHVNWNNFAKGNPTGCFQNSCEFMYAGRLADDYASPVVGPSKFGVMKFDVSSLAGQTINSVTLRLIQTFDPEASVANERTVDFTVRAGMLLAPSTEVYGVTGGEDFDETLSSWNSYTNGLPTPTDATRNAFLNSGVISQLGSMTNVANPGGISGPGAPVTFVDTDLTELVQGWIDGTKPNLGLLLLNSTTLTGAPPAPGDTVARYATHESRERNPSHNWDPPQLIITYGSVTLDGDYNGNGTVDAADYVVWRNGDSPDDTQAGYDLWKANFGKPPGAGNGSSISTSVPEPSTMLLVVAGMIAAPQFLRRRN